jgi:predicted nucleotidyltransferase
MTAEETIKHSVKEIKKIDPNIRTYLFGSRARGMPQKYSDIDIALESKKKITSFSIFQIKQKIENIKSMFEVQIVDLANTSDKFSSSVKAYAKEV